MNKLILKLSIFNSVNKGLLICLNFFLGVYFRDIGLSGAQIGVIFATATIVSIITILPSGISNDRLKSKHLITIALLLIALQYIGLSATTSFGQIVALFFFGGIGNTLYVSSIESLFHKTTEKKEVEGKIGTFQGLNYLMIGSTMILAGYLLNAQMDFTKLFLAVGITFVIVALIAQIILPDSTSTKFNILHYKKDFFQPKVLLFALIVFLFAIHFGAENTAYGLFLQNNLELNRLQMGLYMGLAIMIMGPTAILIGRKLKREKFRTALALGLLFSGLGHILMTVKITELSFLFRVIHEIADAATFFCIFFGINQLFDMKRIGGNAAIFTFTMNIAATFGALIFAPMGTNFGYHLPLIVSGITSLAAFMLALLFTHKFTQQQ